MTVEAVAFWAAVALPFASLAVLFGGPVTRVDFVVLLALLSTNVAALYVGRGHTPDRRGTGDPGGDDRDEDAGPDAGVDDRPTRSG